MKLLLIVLATLVAMVVCGALALFGTVVALMELGLARHDNYEYYGQSWLVYLPAVVAFAMPAILVAFMAGRRNDRE